MKRENFVPLINAILEQIGFEDEFAKDLQKYFDGHIVSTISSNLIVKLVKMLEDEMNDKDEIISWWLFEGKDLNPPYIEIDDKQMPLYSPGKLYDFLISQK
jgi:ribosomal protein L10